MADNIRVVILADDPDFVDPFAVLLEETWLKSHPDIRLDIRKVQGPAVGELGDDVLGADVLITEVVFGGATTSSTAYPPVRTNLIRTASARVPVVIALASWDDETVGASIREQCEVAGVTGFLYKEKVGPESLSETCDISYGRLVEVGSIEHIDVQCAEGDLLARSVVSELGPGVLGWLYTRLFPHVSVESLHVGFLAQGGSGAYLLHIEARGVGVTQHVALKVSSDVQSLRAQVEGQPAVGQMSPRLYSDCEPREPDQIPSSMGWHAIAHSFAGGARTLREWLLTDASSEKVEPLFESLFLQDGLSAMHGSSLRPVRNRPVLAALQPSLAVRARFAREARGLEPLIIACGSFTPGEYASQLKRVDRFLNSAEVGSRPGPVDVVQCRCHGDLHAGNIMVHLPHGQPFLIDLSGVYCHWASDMARLAVDLLLTCYDGPVASHQWDGVEKWRELLIAASKQDRSRLMLESTEKNTVVVSAVCWLLAEIAEACPAVKSSLPQHKSDWEFQAAIGMELLYSVARTDVSPPKRVASVLAAMEVIDLLEQALSGG